VLARLAQEGKEGKYVYQELVKHMWHDVDRKSKKLEVWMSSGSFVTFVVYFVYTAYHSTTQA